MAWTAVNPVTIANATKVSDYDTLWDNADFLYDWINARTIFTLEDTAPTGWSIVADTGDGLIACKGGANAYNVDGGTKLAGTWTQPTHVHVDGAHTHTTAGFALTSAYLPQHSHAISPGVVNPAAGGTDSGAGAAAFGTNNITSSAGSGDSHDHGNTGSAGSAGNTGASASAATWRPDANVGIIIEHD